MWPRHPILSELVLPHSFPVLLLGLLLAIVVLWRARWVIVM